MFSAYLLSFWYDVFGLLGGIWFIFMLLACFSLYNIMRQLYLVYLLAYFSFFIFYTFLLLTCSDFDLAACTVIIVYGSLLVVVFLLSLSWIDSIFLIYSPARLWGGTLAWVLVLCFACVLALHVNHLAHSLAILTFSLRLVSYYEYLMFDAEEELELIGWGISEFFTSFWLLVIGFLALICVLLVCFFILLRRVLFAKLNQQAAASSWVWFKAQFEFEQELTFNRNLLRFFHRSRF